MSNWFWADPSTVIAAGGAVFAATALPMRIDDAGAVQPLGTYLEKGAVFQPDRIGFDYLMSLADRDLQYRGMRDDRLACFRRKQEPFSCCIGASKPAKMPPNTSCSASHGIRSIGQNIVISSKWRSRTKHSRRYAWEHRMSTSRSGGAAEQQAMAVDCTCTRERQVCGHP